MPTGLGFAPLGGGGSVVGYGLPDPAPAAPSGIMPMSGQTGDGLYVDSVTGQYTFDTYGRKTGMTGVQQLVLMRMKTLLNSSAMKGLGLAAPTGVVGPNTQKQLEQQVRLAMKDLLDAKVISFLGVTVQRMPNGAYWRHFDWRDLTVANPATEQTSF